MRYDYKCPACGNQEERFVPLADRDEQHCHSVIDDDVVLTCGAKMDRQPHFMGVLVQTPETFLISASKYREPQNDVERARWDAEAGVKSKNIF